MLKAPCLHCPEELVFIEGRGFVHDEGGIVVWDCSSCGWKGAPHPTPDECPSCRSTDLRSNHSARTEESRA